MYMDIHENFVYVRIANRLLHLLCSDGTSASAGAREIGLVRVIKILPQLKI
jgi:hypothetical protein